MVVSYGSFGTSYRTHCQGSSINPDLLDSRRWDW